MNLENYACTLEQAKKLKELGVERESIFVWWKDAGCDEYDIRLSVYSHIVLAGYDSLPAYTSQELYEIIQGVTRRDFLLGKAQELAEFLIYLLESKNNGYAA